MATRWRSPPGELPREAVGKAGRQPDAFEQPRDLGLRLAAGAIAQDDRRPRDRVAHPMPGIQRVERVLEDDLNPPPRLLRTPPRLRVERDVVEEHAPRGRGVQPGYRTRDRRLSAPGLSDEGDTATASDGKADVVRRHDPHRSATVLGSEPLDGQHGRRLLVRTPRVPRLVELELSRLLPPEAAHTPPGPDLLQHRRLLGTALDGQRATRPERAALRALPWAGRHAGNPMHPPRPHVVGNRCDEPVRVRVPGIGEHLRRRPFLDDPARVHDRDPVCDLGHDGEIVRDVDHRQAPLSPQALDLGQDPPLRHDVEAGRRLVEDDQRRLANESHGDRHTLLLAARELVRVAAGELGSRRQLHAPERLLDRRELACRRVLVQHVLDGASDSESRVERVGGILRHVGDKPASKPPRNPLGAPAHRLAPNGDLPGDDPGARLAVAEERERSGRLPAPRLADQPDDLARSDLERDLLDDRITARQPDRKVVDGESSGDLVHAGTPVRE